MVIIKDMTKRYVEVLCDGLKYRIVIKYGRPTLIYCLTEQKYVDVPKGLDILNVLNYVIFKSLIGG